MSPGLDGDADSSRLRFGLGWGPCSSKPAAQAREWGRSTSKPAAQAREWGRSPSKPAAQAREWGRSPSKTAAQAREWGRSTSKPAAQAREWGRSPSKPAAQAREWGRSPSKTAAQARECVRNHASGSGTPDGGRRGRLSRGVAAGGPDHLHHRQEHLLADGKMLVIVAGERDRRHVHGDGTGRGR